MKDANGLRIRATVTSTDTTEDVNQAIAVPNKLVDPETGRVFPIRNWVARVPLDECVTVEAEMLVKLNKQ